MLLYRQSSPSPALVLVADTNTLRIGVPASSTKTASSPQVEIALEHIQDFDVLGCHQLCSVHSSLGLVQLVNPASQTGVAAASEIFLAVIANAQPLTSRYSPEEQVSRIQSVHFYSVSSGALDDYWRHQGGSGGGNAQEGTEEYTHPFDAAANAASASGTSTPTQLYDANGTPVQHPASAMRKILSNGHFYFSSGGYDISTRLEERIRRRDALSSSSSESQTYPYDSRFVWNGFLMDSMLDFRSGLSNTERDQFDNAAFVVTAIQGFVGVSDFTLQGNPVTLAIVSRLGSARAGTRFNARGIDDDGNVANFVETETIFRTRDSVFSFVQIRGSIPLFWEQQGTTPFGGQKLQITRPPIASQPAFNKHFSSLASAYPQIQVVNLLSTRDHEALLSNAYREHARTANAQLFEDIKSEKQGNQSNEIGYTEFDFHSKVKSAGGIEHVRENIRRDPPTGGKIDEFAYCLAAVARLDDEKEESKDNGAILATAGSHAYESLLTRQEGVFRTNCLDCLDRTNVVQDILSRLTLEHYLRHLVPAWANSEILLSAHRTLWAENGDALSRIYAGTGALNTSFTRSGKRTFAGALSDATKSVSRMYISNFMDKGKQQAIDGLLGNLASQQKVVVVDPIRDSVDSALNHRASEYSSNNTYTIMCGTYNVNGKSPGQENFLPWLFPDTDCEPDIIALGFQELVELSPQQIMATDPEKLRRWQAFITKEIAERPKGKAEYVLLRSDQLVGTCIIVFMKNDVAKHIRNVEAATKKTGLKGMAGNKGAVAVRLDFNDTSFCFVTAHFAAGHSNFEQRNMDYATIANGLQFRRGRQIQAHDNIIYFGDLNYRIQLPNDEVRHMASIDDFSGLIEGDQLTQSIKNQLVFAGYKEGPLLFRPTYKYDNGTETYDTSEKQRIPSWTDRVLYKGDNLALFRYDRAELMCSDHRPVYALLKAEVRVVDHVKKENIARELLAKLAPGKVRSQSAANSAIADLLQSDEDTSEAMPEPSSDNSSWWDPLDIAVIQGSVKDEQSRRDVKITNPFDPNYLTSPNSFKESVSKPATITRKPPPPVVASKPSTLSSPVNKPSVDPSTKPKPRTSAEDSSEITGLPSPSSLSARPSAGRAKSSTSSLMDDDDVDGMARPNLKTRETTNEWQVITPSPYKR